MKRLYSFEKKLLNQVKTRRIALFVCFMQAFICNIYGQLTPQDVQQETLTLIEEFSAESHGVLFPDQTYTPVTTFNGATYLVWVNPDRYPMLAKIENGTVQTARLDPSDDYQPLSNGHNKFSIGVDNDGYIHIAGDMHNYPEFVVGHLPARYLNGTCMYWKSDNPGDISSFTWHGGDVTTTNGLDPEGIENRGHTYSYFVNDNNGVLYFASRTQSSALGTGSQGASIERYDTQTKSWTALGVTVNNTIHKHVAWGSGNGYQGMRSDIRFDSNNRMHFTVNNRDVSSNNPDGGAHKSASAVIYAYSDDGGDTFYKSDGSQITLPMWKDSGVKQADVITDNETWVSMPASVAFNQYEEPFVWYIYTNNGTQIAKYRQWSDNNNAWGPISDLPLNAVGWDRQWNDGRGIITLSSFWTGEIYRTSSLDQPGVKHDMSFGYVDRRYMTETGELRGISQSVENDVTMIKIVRLETDLSGTSGTPTLATSLIEAEDFDAQSGVQLSNGGEAVGYIQTGDWIKFSSIDFEDGVNSVVANVSNATANTGKIEFRKSSINGTLLGEVDVPSTGSWTNFQDVTSSITNASGVFDVYLVFTNNLDVNAFQFSDTVIPISAFDQIQAENYNEQSGTQLSNGGTAVGYIDTGDWIKFSSVDFGSGATGVTVNGSKGNNGSGTIEFRSGSITGSLLGTVQVNSTGDWVVFQEFTGSISNASGIEDLYLVFTGGLDVDWIQFTASNNNPGAISAFSQIEAEDFDNQFGVQLSNGGTSVGYVDGGDWIMFEDVDFGSGATSVTANVAKGNNGTRTIEFRQGSVTGTLLGQVQFSNTGGWSSFIDVTGAISNASGVFDLYLVFPKNLLDVNWIQFSNGNASLKATKSTIKSNIENDSIFVYPNPSSNTISINGIDQENSRVKIYGVSGNLLMEVTTSKDINISDLASGVYFIKVGNKTVKFIKE